MTVEELRHAVEVARLAADAPSETDRLPDAVADWHGYGTRPMSVFLNALCRQVPRCRYVEFGSFAGRSLLAAAYGNAGHFTGADDHRWLGQGARKFDSRALLLAKLADAVRLAQDSPVPRGDQGQAQTRVVEVRTMDVATMVRVRSVVPERHAVDVFFYDAGHAADETRAGVEAMAQFLRPGILLMDDYRSSKWPEVKPGALAGISGAGLTVHAHWELPYHTGVGAWVVDALPAWDELPV
jgi:hypothetical protein